MLDLKFRNISMNIILKKYCFLKRRVAVVKFQINKYKLYCSYLFFRKLGKQKKVNNNTTYR